MPGRHDQLKSEFGHNYVDLYLSLLEETPGAKWSR